MGDRYTLPITCKCGHKDEAWYAPTCGFMDWTCPKCGKITDLEKYSGIEAESCASTKYGIKYIKEQRKSKKADALPKKGE